MENCKKLLAAIKEYGGHAVAEMLTVDVEKLSGIDAMLYDGGYTANEMASVVRHLETAIAQRERHLGTPSLPPAARRGLSTNAPTA